jgi:hypothetical protein
MFIEPGGGFTYQPAFDLEQPRACEGGTSEGQETKDHEEYLEILAAKLFMEFLPISVEILPDALPALRCLRYSEQEATQTI